MPHEYHLLRDADHVGPTLILRIERAFSFIGQHLWQRWPSPKDETELALSQLLAPLRERARAEDPTMDRCYGRLPRM